MEAFEIYHYVNYTRPNNSGNKRSLNTPSYHDYAFVILYSMLIFLERKKRALLKLKPIQQHCYLSRSRGRGGSTLCDGILYNLYINYSFPLSIIYHQGTRGVIMNGGFCENLFMS